MMSWKIESIRKFSSLRHVITTLTATRFRVTVKRRRAVVPLSCIILIIIPCFGTVDASSVEIVRNFSHVIAAVAALSAVAFSLRKICVGLHWNHVVVARIKCHGRF